jgi:uncharacterized membrane protein YidH (DUF202 family)
MNKQDLKTTSLAIAIVLTVVLWAGVSTYQMYYTQRQINQREQKRRDLEYWQTNQVRRTNNTNNNTNENNNYSY